MGNTFPDRQNTQSQNFYMTLTVTGRRFISGGTSAAILSPLKTDINKRFCVVGTCPF